MRYVEFIFFTHSLTHLLLITRSLKEDHSIEDYDSISVDRSSRQDKNNNAAPIGDIETLTSKQYVKFNLNNMKKVIIHTRTHSYIRIFI